MGERGLHGKTEVNFVLWIRTICCVTSLGEPRRIHDQFDVTFPETSDLLLVIHMFLPIVLVFVVGTLSTCSSETSACSSYRKDPHFLASVCTFSQKQSDWILVKLSQPLSVSQIPSCTFALVSFTSVFLWIPANKILQHLPEPALTMPDHCSSCGRAQTLESVRKKTVTCLWHGF